MRLPLLLALACLATAAEQRIEAEGTTNAAAMAADWAWGGRAAVSANAWQPLLSATPAGLAGEVHVWLRHRNGAVCLKAVEAGTQVELGWAWSAPEEFTWSHLGPFPAARLAGGLVVIRGDREAGRPDTELDCVVLSGAASMPADPPLAARAGVEAVGIAWDAPVATTTRLGFGLNLFQAFNVEVQSDPRYRAALARMRPGFVRLHHAGQGAASSEPHGLWDVANRRFDAAKIAKLCPLWRGIAPEIMMNISGWPEWMDADRDGLLDEDRIADYAAACAELVRLVNIEGRVGIRWWETSNERDGAYWLQDGKPKRTADLARIHAACAAAMRAVDPGIAVGGPAATRPDKREELAAFAAAAGPSLEFLSFHAYASGSAADSDAHLLRRARSIAEEAQLLQTRIAAATGRAVPGFLDEYNISWTWETRDPRMTDQFSAVFDALLLTEAARRGIQGTAAWNECDGIYGKMDNAFALRPAAEVFARANQLLVGEMATVAAGPDAPAVLAVRRADGSRAAMLTNLDRRTVRVRLAAGSGSARLAVLARGAIAEQTAAWDAELELPGRSVAWLSDPDR